MRLTDVLWNYHSLVARLPLAQWRFPGPEELFGPERCCYCKPAKGRVRAMTCTHRDPDYIEEGRLFLASFRQEVLADPLMVVALKVDIDRCIDALPGKARDMFHLLFRVGGNPEPVKPGEAPRYREFTFDEVRQMIGMSSLKVADRMYKRHLRGMERELADWIPASRGDYSVTLVSA